MSKSLKQVRRPKKLPLWISVSLIAVLGAVALALSYLAVTGASSGEHPGLPVRTEVAAAEEVVMSSVSLPGESQPEAPGNEPAGPTPYRLLAMVNGTAMRATGGTCASAGTVEISLDAGQSWSTSYSLAEAGATQILRLLPADPSLVQVVALDANCEPQVYRSADLGTTWTGPLSVAGTWYFNPFDPEQVGAPDGPQAVPCAGTGLAPAGDRAAVRCTDGSVVTTADRGLTWSEATGVSDILAINSSPDSYVMAQAPHQTCEGVRLTSLGTSNSTLLDGCFEASFTAEELNAGNIAVAQSGTYTLLWAGDDLVMSTDGGTTWQ